jgi:hypothetical protein
MSDMMEDDNERPSTDDEVIRIIMDVYKVTEQEARRALRAATTVSGMADF